MTLKSGAGIVCTVRDVAATVAFYERLGFTFKRNEPGRATAYINWWWIDFIEDPAADVDNERSGARFYFSVDSVPRAYEQLTAGGIQPLGPPVELRGNREFTVVDPDGHRLVFFKRK